MNKPQVASHSRIIAANIKPVKIDINRAANDPAARTLEAVKPDGRIVTPAPFVPPSMVPKIGTSESFVKGAAGKYQHRFILHLDAANNLLALDSYPVLEFMARMYPTEMQDLETVAVRVDPLNGSLSVDTFQSGLAKCAPYMLHTQFPALYAAINALSADQLLPETDLGGIGQIESVTGQVIVINIPRPDSGA